MSAFTSVAIPFVRWGNRRALADEQLANSSWLQEFFERFRHCFERHEMAHVWLFIEK